MIDLGKAKNFDFEVEIKNEPKLDVSGGWAIDLGKAKNFDVEVNERPRRAGFDNERMLFGEAEYDSVLNERAAKAGG